MTNDKLINIPCPHCGKVLGLRTDQFGRLVRCPACKQTILADLPSPSNHLAFESSKLIQPDHPEEDEDDREEVEEEDKGKKCTTCGSSLGFFYRLVWKQCRKCRKDIEEKKASDEENRLAIAKRQAEEEARRQATVNRQAVEKAHREATARKQVEEEARHQEAVHLFNIIKRRLANNEVVYFYESVYLQVDSEIIGKAVCGAFSLGTLHRLGLLGWEIVSVIPKTSGVALTNQTGPTKHSLTIMASEWEKNQVSSTWGAGVGGNVVGVYVVLRLCVTSINCSDDMLLEYAVRHRADVISTEG